MAPSIFLVYCRCGRDRSLAGSFLSVADAEEMITERTPALQAVDEDGFFFINEMRIGQPSNFELRYRLQNNICETNLEDAQFEFDRLRALYHHRPDE